MFLFLYFPFHLFSCLKINKINQFFLLLNEYFSNNHFTLSIPAKFSLKLSFNFNFGFPFAVVCNPHAKRLYDDLLNNYNRLIRPVSNNTEKLTVKLGLKLSQLIDVVSQTETNNWNSILSKYFIKSILATSSKLETFEGFCNYLLLIFDEVSNHR